MAKRSRKPPAKCHLSRSDYGQECSWFEAVPEVAGDYQQQLMERHAMYERFTDRTRKVFLHAQNEAHRMNHEHIGTEHILLGMLKDPCSIATTVLRHLGADAEKIKAEIFKTVVPWPELSPPGGKVPQAPRAKQAVQAAMEASTAMNHNYVGTEHLLLGLVADPESVASQVLANCGVTADAVRGEITRLLSSPEHAAKLMPEQSADVARLLSGMEAQLTLMLGQVREAQEKLAG